MSIKLANKLALTRSFGVVFPGDPLILHPSLLIVIFYHSNYRFREDPYLYGSLRGGLEHDFSNDEPGNNFQQIGKYKIESYPRLPASVSPHLFFFPFFPHSLSLFFKNLALKVENVTPMKRNSIVDFF